MTDESGYVDGVSEFDLGCSKRIAVVGGRVGVPVLAVGAGCFPRFASNREKSLHCIAVHRRLEHSRCAGKFGGAMPHRVHLDVIGVAVVAVPVVHGEHVGAFLAQDRGQSFGRIFHRRLPERFRVVVLLPPSHPTVLVTEPHQAMQPERRGGCFRLGTSPMEQRLSLGQIRRHFSVLTVGRDHEDDAMALRRSASHAAPSGNAFVVGMCMKAHERSHLVGSFRCVASCDRASGNQFVDSLGTEAPVRQHFAAVLAGMRGRRVDVSNRA